MEECKCKNVNVSVFIRLKIRNVNVSVFIIYNFKNVKKPRL